MAHQTLSEKEINKILTERTLNTTGNDSVVFFKQAHTKVPIFLGCNNIDDLKALFSKAEAMIPDGLQQHIEETTDHKEKQVMKCLAPYVVIVQGLDENLAPSHNIIIGYDLAPDGDNEYTYRVDNEDDIYFKDYLKDGSPS